MLIFHRDVHGVTIISIVKTIIKNINITPTTKSDSNCDELRFFKRNSRAFDDETTCGHQRMCRVTGVGRPTSVSLDNCYGLSQGVWVFLSILGIPNSPNSPWVSIRSHGMSWPSMTTGWWLGVNPYENKAKHKVTSYLWLAKGAFCHSEWDKTHFKLNAVMMET